MIDFSPLDRHERIALGFSGGKDSLALIYLFREYLPRITVYHMDTGDLLPEMRAAVESATLMIPNFIRVQGDVMAWIDANGLPTDLLPYSMHPLGQMAGQADGKLVARYDCCFANLMLPLYQRMSDDGMTLLIRGTKTVDLKRLPTRSGQIIDGKEIWNPIEDWSHDDVFAYLKSVGAPHNPVYDSMVNSPECARCSAWWSEGRATYLREKHPVLFTEYRRRLEVVADAVTPSINAMHRELGEA